MSMNIERLRALVEDKDPADLTPEECAALREAIRTSPELLRAVADRIQIDEHLARALGRPQVSVERVLDRLARRRARAIGTATRYGFVVCVVAVAVLAAVIGSRGWRTRPVEVAAGPADERPVDAAERLAAPAAPAAPAAETAAEVTGPEPVDAAPLAEPPAAAQPAEPLRVAGLFDPAAAEDATPDAAALDRWFSAVDKLPLKLASLPIEGRACGRLEGLARLRRRLVDGAALRLSSPDFSGLRIHVWSGTQGVTLHAAVRPSSWVAYATTRAAPAPLPGGYVTVARDDGRTIRTNPVGVQRVELRCMDGLVTLARGDVRLVEAPLANAPTDVFLEGAVTLRDLALVAAAPIPPLPASADRPTADLLAGGRAAWIRGGDPTAGFTVRDDGTATLAAVDNKQPAWAVLPLPRVPGPAEIVVRLEGVAPGTGLVLADANRAPQSVLRFLANTNAPGVVQADRKPPQDPAIESPEPLASRPFVFVRDSVWLRLRQCGGVQRIDVSGDGRHWVRGAEPQPAFAAVGLHVVPHASARSITLTALRQGAFPRLDALASAGLRDAAVELPPQGPLAAWLAAADASRPPAADAGDWRRACALKAIAGNAPKDLALDLLGLLWRECLAMEPMRESRQDLLDDILALAPVADDPAAAARIAGLFTSLGAAHAAAGDPRCLSAIDRALAAAPLRSGEPFVAFPEPLARREILGLLAAQDVAAVAPLVERLSFFGFTAKPRNDVFFAWADAVAHGRLAGPPAAPAADWRHPLRTTPGKEGLSVQAELSSALAAADWQDACRLIDAAAADESIDLLADRRDPDLLVSLPVAVATAMRDEPPLLEAMRRDRERIAGLRLLEATATGHAGDVEAVTVQFHGTAAAAEAHAWLGDRSLAAGRFAAARRHYAAAVHAVPPAADPPASRIAAALDLAQRLGGGETAAPPRAHLPVSADVVARPLARLEGDVGGNPAGLPEPLARGGLDWPPQAVDWVARQVGVLPRADRVLVANRFHVASHDAATGAVQWRAGLGGDAANAHDWPGHPMRPVADAARAYVRRLRKAGPAIAAIELSSGTIAWEAPSQVGRWFVSDPLLTGEGTLVVCTAATAEDAFSISLTTLDAATGRLVREAPLVTLGGGWWAIRDCHLVAADGTWVVVAGGAVVACDLEGRLLWARRDTWTPPTVDAFWMLAAQGSSLFRDGRIHVVRPGVPGLVTLDAASGRVLWRIADPAVSRVRGVAAGRLVVERIGTLVAETPAPAAASGDLLALDPATGGRAWRFGPVDLLDAHLTTDDGLLAAVREPVAGKNTRIATLVRLDPATGRATHRWPLAASEDPLPFAGPLVPSAGAVWGFLGRGAADATRDLVSLAAP